MNEQIAALRAERDQARARADDAHHELVTEHFLRTSTRAGLRDGCEETAIRLATEHRLFALVVDNAGNVVGLRTAVIAAKALFPELFGEPPGANRLWPGSEPGDEWREPADMGLRPLTVVTRHSLLERS